LLCNFPSCKWAFQAAKGNERLGLSTLDVAGSIPVYRSSNQELSAALVLPFPLFSESIPSTAHPLYSVYIACGLAG